MNIERNYLRINEYEIKNINENKRDKKREYNPFEKGLINIRENKKEIEREEKLERKRRESNHHSVYISNNISKENKKYKTSTQNINDSKRNKYTLDNLNEYEIDYKYNNKYDKYKKEKKEEYKKKKTMNTKRMKKNIKIQKKKKKKRNQKKSLTITKKIHYPKKNLMEKT